ncbi:hypothetical protein WMY93_007264 [Mugilogobius chulae]|uniref:ribonuclease H n=1 Tax=Mugilogobius chulae TaxID=88201 RepID=A0AAW0PQJ9_9GOBI
MLQSLQDHEGDAELACASHVQQLLGKLPAEYVANYARYSRTTKPGVPYNLLDFATWLEDEAECQAIATQTRDLRRAPRDEAKPHQMTFNKQKANATILHGTSHPSSQSSFKQSNSQQKSCPFCAVSGHHVSVCPDFRQLSTEAIQKWIKDNDRCWRCLRSHRAASCDLKKLCPKCNSRHLGVLHEVNQPRTEHSTSCLIRSSCSSRVLLKVVKVQLSYRGRDLDTYAILDDGSERTMLLATAAQALGLHGAAESMLLKTVRQGTESLDGAAVTFNISPAFNTTKKFVINNAFTADKLGLAPQTYPPQVLRRYRHLQSLPLHAFQQVQPLILIGSDHPHLICPIEKVRLGPGGGPAAVCTRLGWALQGPIMLSNDQPSQVEQSVQSFFVSCKAPDVALYQAVEKLWKLDVIPFLNQKVTTRSKQDQYALDLLESKTIRLDIGGVQRYATPLLRIADFPQLAAPKESVLYALKRTEKKLSKNPQLKEVYNKEILKLLDAGYIKKLTSAEISAAHESWYIPHHIVEHNEKQRLVFNCSFEFHGQNLNRLLLPGPVLGPSLLGVLLRFRQHPVAISGDIKAMFHQIRLLPKDCPLLRFLWRNMEREAPVDVYEWQVLPFGTTSSPCCAIYAVQRHVRDHQPGYEDVLSSVLESFYVDICLQSFPTEKDAVHLLNRLRALLSSGGFEIRQWMSNLPSVTNHLPKEARSDNTEIWLSHDRDALGYRHRVVPYDALTLRNIYRILASQYDPLGFLIPFTTRAKVLIQKLWEKKRDWDDPCLPEAFIKAWKSWEAELPMLSQIRIPRCYGHLEAGQPVVRELHVFCDASEVAYGSVAYLRLVQPEQNISVSFVMARSRVAPKRQLTVPRLELCAAHTGAQLANLVRSEFTFPLDRLIMWTDSTTVLTWLQSETCQYKIFVAHRITEILELTDVSDWRYIESSNNPADDITRGKSLAELAAPHRWHQGPPFLLLPCEKWPSYPMSSSKDAVSELKKSAFCGNSQLHPITVPSDITKFQSWEDLVDETLKLLPSSSGVTPDRSTAENVLLRHAQQQSFPEDYALLQSSKPISVQSRLINLTPEFDQDLNVIRVGGRLRHCDALSYQNIHPIVLDPANPITHLLIKSIDQKLHHPGSERVLASLRRSYWILRGRQAVKKVQQSCLECKKWKAKPLTPRMADLPPYRLRLFKPPFWSTGMDCFGPFHIKIGRRHEKRWGILFKCLTTRCIHIDLLTSLDTDSFLMSFRRFVARRGTPSEVISDQGTNFVRGEREIQRAFDEMSSSLQEQLARHKIRFLKNPPHAPHFGGVWEREVRAIKTALRVILGAQTVTEEVLRTVLIEVEEILNSRPLGYLSASPSDPEPVTPNLLLMGRLEAALPQVVYADTQLFGTKRWRYSQVLADQFWVSFIKRYLPTLQSRQKWQLDQPNLTVNTVVMVVDSLLPRASWPVGIVSKLLPSSDGRVRVAEVKIKEKTYLRPVTKLVPLTKIQDDEDS